MSDSVSLEMPDMAAFLAELNALPRQMKEKVMRGAVATGASVIRKAAIALAPVDTGNLQSAIYQVRLPEKGSPTSEVFKVDVRMGRSYRTGKGGIKVANVDAYYAEWVEFGHFTRASGMTANQHKKARIAGLLTSLGAKWVPPKPFMRPAFELNKTAALDAMSQYIDDNLPLATAANKFLKAA